MPNGYILLWTAYRAWALAGDRATGGGIFAGSLIGIVLYGLLLLYYPDITLVVTAFLGVVLIFGILAWIGYTMATTPPPEPMEEMQEPEAETKTEPQTKS